MDGLLCQFGIDWAIECSAADSAALKQRQERGEGVFALSLEYLCKQSRERGSQSLKEQIWTRWNGKRFGKTVATKLGAHLWLELLAKQGRIDRSNGVGLYSSRLHALGAKPAAASAAGEE